MQLLIECNASGDAEQVRETVNRGRLHAGVNHNPNFIRCRRWPQRVRSHAYSNRQVAHIDVERPSGRRFGALVHAVLVEVDLNATAASKLGLICCLEATL
jgi:hypothetical protein